MGEVKRTDAIAGDIIHEYDGIEEADNELPTWWLAIFIGTTIFAGAYWLAYEQFEIEPPAAEALAAAQAAERAKAGEVSDDDLLAEAKNAASVAQGKQAFTTNCVACHAEKGEGKIGPNLTDANWLHGGAPVAIFNVVKDGVLAKGMPAWGPVLGPAATKSVVAYVLTLRNTNVAGKEPQGELYKGP